MYWLASVTMQRSSCQCRDSIEVDLSFLIFKIFLGITSTNLSNFQSRREISTHYDYPKIIPKLFYLFSKNFPVSFLRILWISSFFFNFPLNVTLYEKTRFRSRNMILWESDCECRMQISQHCMNQSSWNFQYFFIALRIIKCDNLFSV